MCGSRLSRISRNSSPTRHASGPPPNVDPCIPGLMAAAALAFARMKPSGIPQATGLAATTTSGSTTGVERHRLDLQAALRRYHLEQLHLAGFKVDLQMEAL